MHHKLFLFSKSRIAELFGMDLSNLPAKEGNKNSCLWNNYPHRPYHLFLCFQLFPRISFASVKLSRKRNGPCLCQRCGITFKCNRFFTPQGNKLVLILRVKGFIVRIKKIQVVLGILLAIKILYPMKYLV